MTEHTPSIYVDSCIYFDLLVANKDLDPDTGEPRWKLARALFDAVNDDRVVLAASALIEAEVACLGPYRDGSTEAQSQVRGWFNAPSTKWTDVDRFLERDAAQLSRTWTPHRASKKCKLGGADATHLAAAVRLRCDYLMTHDGGFPLGHTVNGVQVQRPEAVWVRTLDDAMVDQESD